MRKDNVVIGMKVVPIDKSVGIILSDSKEWERAKTLAHKYLYITRYYEDMSKNLNKDVYILNHLDDSSSGDYYCVTDFIEYVEPVKIKENILLDYSVKELINEIKTRYPNEDMHVATCLILQ